MKTEFSKEELVDSVLSFINAQTWEEKKKILTLDRDRLFTEGADQVFQDLIQRYKDIDDSEAVDQLRLYRKQLNRCRNEGIDMAFKKESNLVPQDVQEAVLQFVNEKDIALVKQIVETYLNKLFHESAGLVFKDLLDTYKDDDNITKHIKERQELLALCGRQGINETFSKLTLEVPMEVVHAVDAFMNAKTNEEAKYIIISNEKLLLTDLAIYFLNFIIDTARESNDEIMLKRCVVHREILIRCMKEGTDKTFEPSALAQSLQRENGQNRIDPEQMGRLITDLESELQRISIANYGIINESDLDELVIRRPELAPALNEKLKRKDSLNIQISEKSKAELRSYLGELLHLEGSEALPRKIELYHKALMLVPREGLPDLWATLQAELAKSLSQVLIGDRAKNLEESIECHLLASEVYKRQTNPIEWASNQQDLGNAYMQRVKGDRAENLEEAKACYEAAFEILKSINDNERLVGLLGNLAHIYEKRIKGNKVKNFEEASKWSNLMLEKLPLVNNPIIHANAYMNRGNIYSQSVTGDQADNIEQGLHFYQKALKIFKEINNQDKVAELYYNIANAYNNRIYDNLAENIEKAIEYASLTMDFYSKYPRSEKWADTHDLLGSLYTKRLAGDQIENIEQGIKHYNLALEVYTRRDFPTAWAKTNANLSGAYARLCRFDPLKYKDQLIYHSRLALQVYGRYTYPERWASLHYNLGLAFGYLSFTENDNEKEAFFDRAIEHYNFSLEVRSPEDFPGDCMNTLSGLGNLYFEKRSWSEANKYFDKAIKIGDNLFAEAFTEIGRKEEIKNNAELFARSAYCLLMEKRYNEALFQIEKGNARLLTESLKLDKFNTGSLDNEQYDSLIKVRNEVQNLEFRMRSIGSSAGQQSYLELSESLKQKRLQLKNYLEDLQAKEKDFQSSGFEISNILSAIPTAGAIIVPVITSQGSAIFILTHGIQSVNSDNIILLDNLIDQSVQSLLFGTHNRPGWLSSYMAWQNGGSDEAWFETIEDCTYNLWQVLMHYIHGALQRARLVDGAPLLIIPNGGLALIPLHAAWYKINDKKVFFIDHYTVSYAPSINSFSICQHRLKSSNKLGHSLLAVIDPTADLSFSHVEVEAIVKQFSKGSSTVLIGREATVDSVLNSTSNKTYLHFACHGYYNWSDVLQSGLLLAKDEQLNLSDILSSHFDISSARLITLSACETGLTEFRNLPGEYIGFPTGFMQAGSPGIVSTLWAVSDFTTSLLMGYFYQKHIGEGMEPESALREAQIWLRKSNTKDLIQYSSSLIKRDTYDLSREIIESSDTGNLESIPFDNPFYWAAFTFYGK
jgi:CHAT domain-containing protein/tetratricopeptide (TPR) repeat protein